MLHATKLNRQCSICSDRQTLNAGFEWCWLESFVVSEECETTKPFSDKLSVAPVASLLLLASFYHDISNQ